MIPKNAIKKVKNDIHLEIAAGSLIAYGVFPQTAEGIQKAKETAASKDTWLAPSDLPEYYDGIDSDLLTGKENDAIRAIRKTLKEFYGISSAGTEGSIDTRVSRPATPPGLLDPKYPWQPVHQVGPAVWLRLKGKLTGRKIPELGNEQFTSYVKLSDDDANKLIENIKKSGYYPQMDRTDKSAGAYIEEDYQNWLVDTYLPGYGQTQVYNPGDKFVDDGKEFADKIVTDLDDALEEKSNEIMDDIDAIIAADKKKYEDFKKQLNRKVDHPELYEELQHIQPRYMWGQNGLYDLEFKSDIDRAIYFAGKLSTKDTPDKVAVRAWLKDVTGLDVREDYREVKEYRNKILALILQLVKLHPNERDVVVPPVYDGYYQDPEEEEEEEDEEEMDDEEYDDLYGSNLDDLLDSLKDDEGEDPEEIAEEIEEKKQELEEAAEEDEEDFGSEDDIPDELLRDPVEDDEGDIGSEDDIPDELFDDTIDPSVLEEIINKRKGKTGTKEKKSYYVSNTKLLQGITKSLAAVTGQLEQVNQSLLEQNQLIQTNIDLNLASLEALQAQDDILTTKFDAILNAFQQQYEASQKAEEDVKRLKAEQKLEGQISTAGTEDPEDLTKGGKGGGRRNRIQQYFRKRLVRQLYRKLPRQVRSLRTRARKLQRMPGKAVGRIKNTTASTISRMLPSKASNFGKNIVAARSASRNMGGLSKLKGVGRNVPGLRQALAVWEYGDRKAAGQTDVQATVGVGGGLAGAAAGAAIGTMLFPGVGTLAGLLIGAAFSAAGAYAGSKIADTVTGVEDKQYEKGTPEAKPGTAMLHGTELLIDKDKEGNLYGINTVGATLIAATSKFINSLGPAGASVAPLFEQKAAPLIQLFGAPATTAQTNVGGGFPSIGSIFKKAEKKKETSIPDEYEGMSREEIEMFTGNSDSFAEKLLKMIDPGDKFKNFLDSLASKIRNPFTPLENYDGTGIEGDLKGNIVNPMEQGELQDYPGAMFGAPRSGGRKHKGRDIIGTPGMKFVAALPGKVTEVFEVADIPGGGVSQGITVQHANNIKTRYLHVTPSVKQGDQVKAGQKLGVITKTDSISSAPHLHFEMIINGTHVDPDKAGNSILRKAYKMADIQAGKVPGLSLDPSGKTPLETYDGTPTSGQEITQNFGMKTGEERMFTSGNKQYKAHKTAKGFEFFDGMMPIQTRGGQNNQLVRDFMESQGVQFERTEGGSIADDFMRKNGITASVQQKPFEFINQKNTDTSAMYMIVNQQQAPAKAVDLGVRFIESGTGKWVTDKEYDVKTLEKLRLSLQ